MQGIISEQELFSQLETIYENDKNQYIQSVVDKSQTDEEFFNAVMTNYPELYNELLVCMAMTLITGQIWNRLSWKLPIKLLRN